MSKLFHFGTAQCVVLVVGLALALKALGDYLVGFGAPSGWVAYAPLSNAIGPVSTLHRWVQLVIWLVLIAVWVVASVWILRRRDEPGRL